MHQCLKIPNPFNFGRASACRLGPVLWVVFLVLGFFLRQSKTGNYCVVKELWKLSACPYFLTCSGSKDARASEKWGGGGGFWGTFAGG